MLYICLINIYCKDAVTLSLQLDLFSGVIYSHISHFTLTFHFNFFYFLLSKTTPNLMTNVKVSHVY